MPDLSTTTWIIIAISLGLFILLTVAYAVQTIEKNNRERRRLESALRLRAREFEELLSSLPASLLGRELRLLLCQGLEDVYSQLQTLGRNSRQPELEQVRQLRAAIANEPEQPDYQSLGNPIQVREVQRQLKLIHNYLLRLRENGRLANDLVQRHVRQLRHTLVLTSLDGYQMAAQDAIKAEKPRLALHYYRLALERMQKNNPGGFFNERIAQMQTRIATLEQDDQTSPREVQPSDNELNDAWKSFDREEVNWQKKNLYD